MTPADATGKRPSQSVITNATEGNIPCVYPHADFKRLLKTDERLTTIAASHDLHRDIRRRMYLSYNA